MMDGDITDLQAADRMIVYRYLLESGRVVSALSWTDRTRQLQSIMALAGVKFVLVRKPGKERTYLVIDVHKHKFKRFHDFDAAKMAMRMMVNI
jgi:hypothetical protein